MAKLGYEKQAPWVPQCYNPITESVEIIEGSGREEVEEQIYADVLKGDQDVEMDNFSDIDQLESDEPLAPPSKKQHRPEPLALTAYIDIISPPCTQRAKETSEAQDQNFSSQIPSIHCKLCSIVRHFLYSSKDGMDNDPGSTYEWRARAFDRFVIFKNLAPLIHACG